MGPLCLQSHYSDEVEDEAYAGDAGLTLKHIDFNQVSLFFILLPKMVAAIIVLYILRTCYKGTSYKITLNYYLLVYFHHIVFQCIY